MRYPPLVKDKRQKTAPYSILGLYLQLHDSELDLERFKNNEFILPTISEFFHGISSLEKMNQNGPEQHGAKTNEEINYLMHADNIYGVYFSKGTLGLIF